MILRRIKNKYVILVIFITVLTNGGGTSYAQQGAPDGGLPYLQSTQNLDSSWDRTATSITDVLPSTTTVLDVLAQLEEAPSSQQLDAINYLSGQSFESTDYISRRLKSLSGSRSQVPSDLSTILGLQNDDFGWGGAEGFTSNVLNTSLVLLALTAEGSTDLASLSQISDYLLSSQNPDGGWGIVAGARSSIYITALVMQALSTQPQTAPIASALANGTDFLLLHQHPGGGYSNVNPTVWETAHAFLALSKTTGDVEVRTAALDYLLTQQQPNGSWDDDPFHIEVEPR